MVEAQSAGPAQSARRDFASEVVVGEGTVGCHAVVSKTRGKRGRFTVERHAVVSETRGKQGRFTSEKKRGRVGSGMEGKII